MTVMKDIVIFILLDDFADWEAAFLAPALRAGVMPGRPGHYAVRYAAPGGVPVRSIVARPSPPTAARRRFRTTAPG